MQYFPKTRYLFAQTLCLFLSLAVAACGSEDVEPDATIADANAIDAVVECTTDVECNDGLYCTGEETCSPAGQCQSGIVVECNDGIPCTVDICSNQSRECVAIAPDVDNDGHGDSSCLDGDGVPLGDDCDDLDENRFPGNVEFCDAEDHDEDCDSDTFGIVDVDSDGFASDSCCNIDELGDPVCGNDCDDTRDNIHIGVTEACDGLDNDCNGMVDEGVLVPGFFDGDADGYGDDSQPLQLCFGQGKFALQGGDCDDANPTTNPGQLEFCDGVDNDCRNGIDDNPQTVDWYLDNDNDLYGDPNQPSILSCNPIAGRSVLNSDCNDSAAAINPSAAELCDGLDNDCNGLADFQIGVNDFEDDDGDGLVDISCSPLGTDCDDSNPVTGPGTVEQCDGQDNDCDGNVDENVAETLWYRDLDEDGFGSIASGTLVSCEQPLGYSADGSDCDDTEPSVNINGEEVCNGLDDDCDGTNNEEPAASNSCPSATGATPTCVAESCTFTCNAGLADCDGINNDCEVTIASDASNCGACGTVCDISGGNPDNLSGTCSQGICECAPGFADCDGNSDNGCEVNVLTNDSHCNQCGNACSFLNAFDQCNNGVCELTFCVPGFDDCDATLGCESQVDSDTQCGSCTNDCTSIANTTASCVPGGGPEDAECSVSACLNGFVDCDNGGSNDDGCETDPNTDSEHCGGCFNQCFAGGNSTGNCVGGECECESGFSTCDNNRCGVNLDSDPSFCGDCSTNCFNLVTQGGAECNSGICAAVCDGNFGDCDADPLDCETDFFALDNCGACGTVCTATNGIPTCFDIGGGGGGPNIQCQAQCDMGFQDCDTDPQTCETETNTDTDNCGFCGNVCGVGETCSNGGCFGRVLEVSLGQDFSCLLRDNGEIACWGANNEGQLGDGAVLPGTNSFSPVLSADGVGGFTELASGGQHSCAVGVLGTYCWGRNASGQLGVETAGVSSSIPIEVDGEHSFREIAVGTNHSCAIDTMLGDIFCWGANDEGQLGQDPLVTTSSATPLVIPSASFSGPVEQLFAGDRYTCASTMTQDLYCWGFGGDGQLGIGSTSDTFVPSQVTGYFSNNVSLGTTSSCGISFPVGAAVLSCWGDDTFFQLGNGAPAAQETSPAATTLANANTMSVGVGHACMLTDFNFSSVYCWGNNNVGQTGQGSFGAPTMDPVEVTLSGDALSLAQGSGENHVCAVLNIGNTNEVHCWGDNSFGQVGTDPSTNMIVTSPNKVDL